MQTSLDYCKQQMEFCRRLGQVEEFYEWNRAADAFALAAILRRRDKNGRRDLAGAARAQRRGKKIMDGLLVTLEEN